MVEDGYSCGTEAEGDGDAFDAEEVGRERCGG